MKDAMVSRHRCDPNHPRAALCPGSILIYNAANQSARGDHAISLGRLSAPIQIGWFLLRTRLDSQRAKRKGTMFVRHLPARSLCLASILAFALAGCTERDDHVHLNVALGEV